MELIPFAKVFKKAFVLFFLVVMASCTSVKWTAGEPDAVQMMADITYLADDKLEGRTFGSKGEMKAGDYIAKRFKQLDLKPMGEKGTWFQSLTVNAPNPHSVEISSDTKGDESNTGRNVIGYMDHGAPYTIILGAHYDHLGYGSIGSLHAGEPAIHNGADDNASGVAMILELADRLKYIKDFNFLFMAFTGEENGLWGSNYYCDHPTIDFSKVTAMFNFDMVGRLHENKMAINGTGTSPVWPELIKLSNTTGLTITMGESGIGPSDHTSFYLMDIPSIHFFTGAHEDYHKPSDDVHLINDKGMEIITDMVMALIEAMDEKTKLAFTKTKDPDPSTTPKMEVTLGVLPDYLYDGKGMRIDGVREGKPADNAGMMKGDIIIKLGDIDVKDIYVYMDALSAFHKGDKTKLVALRDGKEMTFDIQF
jgi:peptidase M28-like protein/PDZ domain-containing protein